MWLCRLSLFVFMAVLSSVCTNVQMHLPSSRGTLRVPRNPFVSLFSSALTGFLLPVLSVALGLLASGHFLHRPCCLGGPGPSGVALGGSGRWLWPGPVEAASGALLTLTVPDAGPRSWPPVVLRDVIGAQQLGLPLPSRYRRPPGVPLGVSPGGCGVGVATPCSSFFRAAPSRSVGSAAFSCPLRAEVL